MRFFEHQEQAKKLSRRLIWLYLLAVIITVTATTWLLSLSAPLWMVFGIGMTNASLSFPVGWTALAVVSVVVGGTVYKLHKLSRGGAVVAEELGGQRVSAHHAKDKQRQLLNVVEEMALAAGLPVPKVYLLPEYSINAFAAGLHRRDAVIGITEGALSALDRDELQAVVTHEFSHILNGDMRLNMRLVGLLHGLMMIGMVGQFMLWGPPQKYTVRDDDEDEEGFVIGFGWFGIIIGIMLIIVGFFGTLFAGWIQAAVSRQREYLADASAVQFTRQKDGLISALIKIANQPKPKWRHWQAGEYAHFMFSAVNEDDFLTRLSATHPSTRQRVERLDKRAAQQVVDTPSADTAGYEGWLAFGSSAGHNGDGIPLTSPWLQPLEQAEPDSATPVQQAQAMLDEVMHINPHHMAYASWLRQTLPAIWYHASQDAEQAQALVCALLLAEDDALAQQQQAHIHRFQQGLGLRVAALHARRSALQPAHALALIDLALPALATLPEQTWQKLQPLLRELMLIDNHISLHEWCVWSVLQAHLRPRKTPQSLAWANAEEDIAQVLAWAAAANHDADTSAQAYAQAAAACKVHPEPPERSLGKLQHALQRLDGLSLADKAKLLQAALSAIEADSRIDIIERELMRAIAANLRCPMPPLMNRIQPSKPKAAQHA